MDIDYLRCFIQAAESGSFSEAAEKLYLSPSTVSRRMTRLEQELGVPLFVRHPFTSTLTEAGRNYLPRMREIVFHYDHLLAQIQDDKEGGKRFRLACIGHHLPELLHQIYRELALQYPASALTINRFYNLDIGQVFDSDHSDLLFADETMLTEKNGLSVRPICRATFDFVCSIRHPYAKLKKVPLSALAKEKLILWPSRRSPSSFKRIKEAFETLDCWANIEIHHLPREELLWNVQWLNENTIFTSDCLTALPEYLTHVPIEGIDPLQLIAVYKAGYSNPLLEPTLELIGRLTSCALAPQTGNTVNLASSSSK